MAEALKHVAFLRGLHELSVTITKPFVAKECGSAHMPSDTDMPTDIDSNKEDGPNLIPPPDIAWLWHCHRLAPARYGRHVLHRFQRLVESPQDPFDFQIQDDGRSQAQQTRFLWKNNFHNEPFFLVEEVMINAKRDGTTSSSTINKDAFLEDF